MKTAREAELLRIFVDENDKYHGRPLYEVIVDEARRHGLAGATVLRGTLGYGTRGQVHTAKILRLSEDLPMVVEIVDEPQRIGAFLTVLDELLAEGVVTREKVELITYRRDPPQ